MEPPLYIHNYLLAFFVLFGLLGNAFILKVFSRKRFTKILQVKSFFRFLAIANSVYLLMCVAIFLDTRFDLRVKSSSPFVCKLVTYLDYFTGSVPSHILVVISLERFVSVAFSLSNLNSYMNKKLFQVTVGFVIILCNIIIYSPLLVFIDLTAAAKENANNSDYQE